MRRYLVTEMRCYIRCSDGKTNYSPGFNYSTFAKFLGVFIRKPSQMFFFCLRRRAIILYSSIFPVWHFPNVALMPRSFLRWYLRRGCKLRPKKRRTSGEVGWHLKSSQAWRQCRRGGLLGTREGQANYFSLHNDDGGLKCWGISKQSRNSASVKTALLPASPRIG